MYIRRRRYEKFKTAIKNMSCIHFTCSHLLNFALALSARGLNVVIFSLCDLQKYENMPYAVISLRTVLLFQNVS